MSADVFMHKCSQLTGEQVRDRDMAINSPSGLSREERPTSYTCECLKWPLSSGGHALVLWYPSFTAPEALPPLSASAINLLVFHSPFFLFSNA